MDINGKHIAFACCYEAPYGGNFISMLTSLGTVLQEKYGCKIYFIFPQQASKIWLEDLSKKFNIGYTRKPYNESESDIFRLLSKWHVDLVHTHFENYDIPVAKAIKEGNLSIKMVWHLHDYMSLDKTGLSLPRIRKILSNQKFWNHYGRWGKDAYFIGVSAEVTNFATHYRNHRFSYPTTMSNEKLEAAIFPKAEVIINGIDINRLRGRETYQFPSYKTTFLSFGGEAVSKGISCILDAAYILEKKGLDFEIRITRGYTVDSLFASRFSCGLPSWLKIVEQTNNIATLFDECHCYISASLRETMSMAIAEASIYGLPVIQSDIPGTWWNSHNPSTFLFHVNDAEGLAVQMENVINADKSNLFGKVQITSKNNQSLLSMQAWIERIINIYQIV